MYAQAVWLEHSNKEIYALLVDKNWLGASIAQIWVPVWFAMNLKIIKSNHKWENANAKISIFFKMKTVLYVLHF
jgi:hypothetical protein